MGNIGHEEAIEEAEQIKSIAVLPFEDMSADKDQELFCDGMAETIINTLIHLGGLRASLINR